MPQRPLTNERLFINRLLQLQPSQAPEASHRLVAGYADNEHEESTNASRAVTPEKNAFFSSFQRRFTRSLSLGKQRSSVATKVSGSRLAINVENQGQDTDLVRS